MANQGCVDKEYSKTPVVDGVVVLALAFAVAVVVVVVVVVGTVSGSDAGGGDANVNVDARVSTQARVGRPSSHYALTFLSEQVRSWWLKFPWF